MKTPPHYDDYHKATWKDPSVCSACGSMHVIRAASKEEITGSPGPGSIGVSVSMSELMCEPRPEPVRLWAETWVEIPSWEGVSIEPCLDEPRKSILTWPDGARRGWQHAVVSNIDLAGVLWP